MQGRGGPGGWLIIHEPELHHGEDVVVPDLAGWRCERMPFVPDGVAFTIVPDWICEVLSKSTQKHDRIDKMQPCSGTPCDSVCGATKGATGRPSPSRSATSCKQSGLIWPGGCSRDFLRNTERDVNRLAARRISLAKGSHMSNRLATIATRQRRMRTRDAIFALAVTLAAIIGVTSVAQAADAARPASVVAR